jgi:hypothetical protein
MKTLIIHPRDDTTQFLDAIYKGTDATVVTGGLTRSHLAVAIAAHDRIMMMGHGSPSGLFSVGQFPSTSGFVIDRGAANLLRLKQCFFLWCHASDFVKDNQLHGFTSGMFISELYEANFCQVAGATQQMVDEQNKLFVEEITRLYHLPVEEMGYAVVTGAYSTLAKTNPVARYNHNRLRVVT